MANDRGAVTSLSLTKTVRAWLMPHPTRGAPVNIAEHGGSRGAYPEKKRSMYAVGMYYVLRQVRGLQ